MEIQIQNSERTIRCEKCKKITVWQPKKRFCNKCAAIVNTKANREYVKAHGRTPKKHIKKTVKCKCPLCERFHYSTIEWTGNGLPRVYCYQCKSSVSFIESGEAGIDN